MRIVVVTSDVYSTAKARLVTSLGARLSGLAAVPIAPKQVVFWRHVGTLAAMGGAAGLPGLAAGSLAARITRWAGLLPFSGKLGGIRAAAKSLGIGYQRCSGPDDPRLLVWLAKLQPDLVISLQSHRVPLEALRIPRLGWLNLHHGRLPEFRGVFSVFWAMQQGEKTLYATAHLMSTRLDEGPIVAEHAVAVAPSASVAEMEARMWTVSPNVVLEAVERLEGNDSPLPARSLAKPGYYTYPTRRDLQAARLAGMRLR